MTQAILAFALGVVALQWRAELPTTTILGWLVAAGVVLLAASGGRRYWLRPSAAVLFGFVWAGLWAQHRLADALPSSLEGQDIEVVGVVANLPQRFERGLRFVFDVEQSAMPVPHRISLAWYGRERAGDVELPDVQAGQRWRLTVRLKRPHGNVNPGGFDYEGWLFERDIRAVGYVRPAPDNSRLEAAAAGWRYGVERLRAQVRERFSRVLGDAPCTGILTALAIGDQQSISPEYWQVFRRTGVTHLLSVSGLHVTMVAGLAAWLVGWGWRRSVRLTLSLPAQKAAAAAGFLAALGYCLLAGFGIPAQRTLYMLTVIVVALWSGRAGAPSRVLALALLLVLLVDPWAVLSPGFWLSFGAVGVLFYAGAGRLATGHWLEAWGRAQWAVTLGLIPALLALFQQLSLVSPIANVVAIPVVSLLVTPLALLGSLPLGDPLLWLAHGLMSALMAFLQWLAALPWAVWQQAAPLAWAVALGCLGIVWMLLPRGFPARWLGLPMLLPLVLVTPPRPAAGELVVTVLDVGQGLAVHVQTAQHDLLYDAGPVFSEESNSGNRIIVPYLRSAGVGALDTMVISHRDMDHAGGTAAVAAELPPDLLLTSLSDADELVGRLPYRRCVDGDAWEWDGVRFAVLHPASTTYESAKRSNALSCVLKISAPGGSVLLTGDIEASDESSLLAMHGADLRSDVLVPPHHGSRGASTPALVEAVAPHWVVYSAGYRNRFGHPADVIVARYAMAGAREFRTDTDGATVMRLTGSGIAVAAVRSQRRRYWFDR